MTQAKVNIPGVRLVLITKEYYEKALNLARDCFFKQEALSKSLGMKWTEELEATVLQTLHLNMSLMFINEENDDAMAYFTVRIASNVANTHVHLDTMQNKPLRYLQKYLAYCEERADFLVNYGIKEAFHFEDLVVADAYKQRGLAPKICLAAIDMIRNFGIEPVYIKVECSSKYSKRIFEKAGFEQLYEKLANTWEINGQLPFQNTREEILLIVYGLNVKQDEGIQNII